MRIALAAALALLAPLPAVAQQQLVDPDFKPKVDRPAYTTKAPVVAIDEAHANFHTMAGQYAPFAALLSADGYTVRANTAPISAASLTGVDILVIANARGAIRGGDAFSAAEADALHAWVSGGGSLLLIADHAPFGTAARSLAAKFGVDMGLGYAVVGPPHAPRFGSQIEYAGASLGKHPIVTGRGGGETIRRVKTFTGQSLGVPPGATALLTLPSGALEVDGPPQIAALLQGEPVPTRAVGGRAQGLAMPVGKGRLVVMGEAGMFSAQIVRIPGRPDMRFGMSVREYDDQQLALNTLHWLSRLID